MAAPLMGAAALVKETMLARPAETILPDPSLLARTVNRHRQSQRPKDPATKDFVVSIIKTCNKLAD